MKTLIVAVMLVIGFTSCSKDQTPIETPQSKPVFVRVEAVDVEGQAIYSDISVVK